LIEKNYKDVQVIYTRKTDVFLELWERARIANKNHANLFVSIHCNSAGNKSAYGSETYVMGLRRMEENLEVSKRENSVILLEDNQERYQKFDPNDEEAVIAFEIMHSAYLDQSIKYAGYVEKQQEDVQRQAAQEQQLIPEDIDYDAITSLSIEVRQRLKASRPATIGQASRVSGVTPSAISLLLIHLKRLQYRKKVA